MKAKWLCRSILFVFGFSVVSAAAAAAGPRLYWTAGNQNPSGPCSGAPAPGLIQSANGDGSGVVTLVSGLDRPSGIDLDLLTGKVYWHDFNLVITQRANLDGSTVETMFAPGPGAEGLALDAAAGRIYFSSLFGAFDLSRANFDGDALQSLVATGAQGIALNPASGQMYWTNPFGDEIRRANLDGTANTLILGTLSNPPRGIALHLPQGKMYWSAFDPFAPGGPPCRDGFGAIFRANLDGSNVELLVSGLGFPAGVAVDVERGLVFWADILRGTVERAFLDGSGNVVLVSGLNTPNDIALEPTTMAVPALGVIGLLALGLVLGGAAIRTFRRPT